MLNELRKQIDTIDSELIALLSKRLKIAREIARIKKRKNLPILDSQREEAIQTKVRQLAKENGISPQVMENLIQLILDYSRLEMESL